MANLALDTGLASLAFSRRSLLGFLDDIPADKLTHQPVAGANHALWIAGHMAWTDDFFLTSIAGKDAQAPAEYHALFGMGSTPNPDASAYPNLDAVKAQMHANRESLLAWFNGMGDDQLAAPLPEDFKSFAPSFVALASTIAWHEGMHSGQLTLIRKSLGMKPKFA